MKLKLLAFAAMAAFNAQANITLDINEAFGNGNPSISQEEAVKFVSSQGVFNGGEFSWGQAGKYVEGVFVAHHGRVYKCTSDMEGREDLYAEWQFNKHSAWCQIGSPGANQYEPGVGEAWPQAWTDVTPVLDGEIKFDYHFQYPQGHQFYAAGTVVEKDGIAYECKPFPYSGFCGMYNPDKPVQEHEPGVGGYWQDAWVELGEAGDPLIKPLS